MPRERMICQPGHLPTLFCLEDWSLLLEGFEENGAEQGKRIGAVLSLYRYRANKYKLTGLKQHPAISS